jgi:hypothetical protein
MDSGVRAAGVNSGVRAPGEQKKGLMLRQPDLKYYLKLIAEIGFQQLSWIK